MSQEWMTKDILKKCCNSSLEEREDLEDLETTFRRYSTRGRNRPLRSKLVKSYDDDDDEYLWWSQRRKIETLKKLGTVLQPITESRIVVQ
jgi:hypothetical protein